MPQIRCPNCGLNINLERRRKIDLDLIVNSVWLGVKMFTDSLYKTKLLRKTLNLRLKELRNSGMLVKKNCVYMLNMLREIDKRRGSTFTNFLGVPLHKRWIHSIMLILLLFGSSAVAYALAAFFASTAPTINEPRILGHFIMTVEVHDVVDLYAWQIALAYNQSELKVLEVGSGGFVGDDFPTFGYNIRHDGLLLIYGTLIGKMPGKNGSGVLAKIVFGFLVENYRLPEIIQSGPFRTLLFDSKGVMASKPIPLADSIKYLTFQVEKQ